MCISICFLRVSYSTLVYVAWCSEIGSLASLNAPEFHAFSDVREPISLHQAVHVLKLVM